MLAVLRSVWSDSAVSAPGAATHAVLLLTTFITVGSTVTLSHFLQVGTVNAIAHGGVVA